jgi:sugar (pentulose or hexulose) kinase
VSSTGASGIWIGIDLGTQSVRAVAASDNGEVIGSGSAPLVSRRCGSRHEQDPETWWDAVGHACRAAIAALASPEEIRGVAVCGTSGTVLLSDEDGKPLTPGLMYDDARAGDEAELANEHGSALWERLGYNKIQTVWALPKLIWMLRTEAAPKKRYLAHQTDFITARLAEQRLASDLSNALKTGCDTIAERWDMEIMDRLGIPREILPRLERPGTPIGVVGRAGSVHTGIPAGTTIVAGMTDGCASQLSAGAMSAGDWNIVLGTTLVLKGTSPELVHDPNGVVYSHRSPDGQWLPGGASSSGAGALSQHLPGAGLDALSERAAGRAPSGRIAYPLASAQGERFPFVAPEAKGFFLDDPAGDELETYLALTNGLAAIERLCFDYLNLLGFPTDGRISVTGGTSGNAQFNRVRATMLGRELVVPRIAEPAFGMAVLASSASRPLSDALAAMVKIDRTYEPDPRNAARSADCYLRLVESLEHRGWLAARTADHARKRLDR